MLLAQGTLLEGKYRIERLLGAGGMGSVWVAEHTLLQRLVAIKILDTTSTTKDPSAVQRFLREAQTAARIRHDHIVDVLDVGRFDDGTPFLVMELLEGETLTSRIRGRQRLSQGEAADLVDQLLAGLGAAHDAGVIHRDIKPDNCFLARKAGRDHVKLLDFGISKVAGDPREMRMTRTGVVMGTPYYMAPEQARGGKQLDQRCDLYAVGAILYECVTGRVPFEAENVNELLFKIVLENAPLPRALAPELEPAFESLILQAMAREPDARFQSAAAFREALGPFVAPRASGEVRMSDRPPSGPRGPTPISVPTVQSDRSVFRTPVGAGGEIVNAVGDTKPIESDPIPPTLPAPPELVPRAEQATPIVLPALAASSAVRPVSAPPQARNTALFAAAALAIVAVVGGGIYLAALRSPSSAAPATTQAAAGASATTQVTTEKPEGPRPVAPASASTPTASAPSAPSEVASPPTATAPPHPSDSTPKLRPVPTAPKPPPLTSVAPPATTSPLPPPVPTGPATIRPPGTSPRPIDTTL
jgi:serine/threonine-protein kinase